MKFLLNKVIYIYIYIIGNFYKCDNVMSKFLLNKVIYIYKYIIGNFYKCDNVMSILDLTMGQVDLEMYLIGIRNFSIYHVTNYIKFDIFVKFNNTNKVLF